MEFLATKDIDENIFQHTWKASDGTTHGICVEKSVSIEDAYIQMINYVEPIEVPLDPA